MDRGQLTEQQRAFRRGAARMRRQVVKLVRRDAPRSAAPSGEDPFGDDAAGDDAALRVLQPSFGLFGGIEANHLKVQVDESLSGLLLSLPDDSADQLDLRGVHFARRGDRIEVDPQQVRAQQSSYARSAREAEGALFLRGVRTTEEAGAWWMAAFDPPLDVDEVRVFNRMDGLGALNRRLRVSIPGDGGAWVLREETAAPGHLSATLALITRLTQLQVPAAPRTPATMRSLRTRVLAGLAETARTQPLTTDAEEQRLLYALLPTVKSEEGQLSDDEWTLLAHLLVAERKRVRRSATSFRLFSRVLTTRSSLERLSHEIDLAGGVFGLGPLSLTRHGVRELGQLRKESDVHVALMRRVQDEFAALGLPIMLAYGTLLGAVREGDFLEHDDDVDLMYPVEATTAEEARAHADQLCQALAARGFRVWRNESHTALNFHLRDPTSACHVDVFPVLLHQDTATLHMERMKLRGIPRDLVVPARPLAFRGADLLGPADPPGFLQERYGSGWSVADPYYDWIWPLEAG